MHDSHSQGHTLSLSLTHTLPRALPLENTLCHSFSTSTNSLALSLSHTFCLVLSPAHTLARTRSLTQNHARALPHAHCLSVCLSCLCLSACLSFGFSVCLSLSVCQSLSFCCSLFLYQSQTVCLSVCHVVSLSSASQLSFSP